MVDKKSILGTQSTSLDGVLEEDEDEDAVSLDGYVETEMKFKTTINDCDGSFNDDQEEE